MAVAENCRPVSQHAAADRDARLCNCPAKVSEALGFPQGKAPGCISSGQRRAGTCVPQCMWPSTRATLPVARAIGGSS